MTYERSVSGSPNDEPSNGGNPLEDAGFWDHEAVEMRLVDTMLAWIRSPDSEGRFKLGGRISSVWDQYFPTRRDLASWDMLVEHVANDPRPLPLSRADIARRDEASEWMLSIDERDRWLVVEALAWLASGKKQVPWIEVWKSMGRGKPGPDGLRMRYSRAITTVCQMLNAAENSANGVSR